LVAILSSYYIFTVVLANNVFTILSSYHSVTIVLANHGSSHIDASDTRAYCYTHSYAYYSKNDMGRLF
jgi:hypothetical protein